MAVTLDETIQRIEPGLDAIPPAEFEQRDDEMLETRRFRGVTYEQAIGYLENLGGARVNKTTVVGDGWQARLKQGTVAVGPSYRLSETTITWNGDPAVLVPLIYRFRLKTFRAPG